MHSKPRSRHFDRRADHCLGSPTTGGLYFWVCKLKPDAPVLGCEYSVDITNDEITTEELVYRLHWVRIYDSNDFYRHLRQSKVR